MSRTKWACPDCGETVIVEDFDLATIGNPMCADCDEEMNPVDDGELTRQDIVETLAQEIVDASEKQEQIDANVIFEMEALTTEVSGKVKELWVEQKKVVVRVTTSPHDGDKDDEFPWEYAKCDFLNWVNQVFFEFMRDDIEFEEAVDHLRDQGYTLEVIE